MPKLYPIINHCAQCWGSGLEPSYPEPVQEWRHLTDWTRLLLHLPSPFRAKRVSRPMSLALQGTRHGTDLVLTGRKSTVLTGVWAQALAWGWGDVCWTLSFSPIIFVILPNPLIWCLHCILIPFTEDVFYTSTPGLLVSVCVCVCNIWI